MGQAARRIPEPEADGGRDRDRRDLFRRLGWAVPVRNDKFSLWIGCGNADETDGFLCFVEPSKPDIRKLFKKIDTAQDVARVTEALERILSSDSEIRDVRWSVEP